jgi:hypothetical protein
MPFLHFPHLEISLSGWAFTRLIVDKTNISVHPLRPPIQQALKGIQNLTSCFDHAISGKQFGLCRAQPGPIGIEQLAG